MTGLRLRWKAFRERLKGWKTVLFGSAIAGAGTLADLLDQFRAIDLTPLLPPASALRIITAIGVATILLRLVTNTAIGRKDG